MSEISKVLQVRIGIPPSGKISPLEMVSTVIVVATFILLLLSSLFVLHGSTQLAYPVILAVVFVLSVVLRVVWKKRRKLDPSEIEEF